MELTDFFFKQPHKIVRVSIYVAEEYKTTVLLGDHRQKKKKETKQDRYTRLDWDIGGQTGGPARPGTGPSKHGPFRHDPLKHENINRPWRACPWAEVPAQARPEIDLIGPGRAVRPGSPAARKYLNRV